MTTILEQINVEAARLEPASVFLRPMNIVHEIALTRGQKLAALKRWEAEIHARLASASEGMPANDRSAEDADLLEEIEQARALLEKQPEA